LEDCHFPLNLVGVLDLHEGLVSKETVR
jgi:hypothetical protein